MEPIPKNGHSSSSPPPKGFSLTTSAVSEQAWQQIKSYLGLDTEKQNLGIEFATNNTSCSAIDSNQHVDIPWEPTPHPQNRPVAQFGFRYNYEKDIVEACGDGETSNNTAAAAPSTALNGVPRIPQLFQQLLLQPLEQSHENHESSSSSLFSQCIVNVYCPSVDDGLIIADEAEQKEAVAHHLPISTSGSHIPWHVDDPRFGPRILVYTFGESRPLHMRLKRNTPSSIQLRSTVSSNETIATNTATTNSSSSSRFEDDGNESYEYSYYTAHPPHCSYYVLSGESRHDWEHSVPSGSGWRVSITFRTLNPDDKDH